MRCGFCRVVCDVEMGGQSRNGLIDWAVGVENLRG